MRRLTLLGLVIVVVAAFVATSLSAQQRPTKIVLVNSQAALLAHPAGAAIENLRNQAQTEIGDLVASLNALESRMMTGPQLSPEEAERYETLQTSLSAVQNRYRDEISAAAAPAEEAVNAVIRELAQENGYTIVLDTLSAQEARLIVYIDADLDITQLVIDRLRAQ